MKFSILFAFVWQSFVYLEAISLNNPKSNVLPSKETCGRKECDAFPWVVFIPLQSRINNPTADIRCAGVLINKRYIITNKSCLQFVLTKVHLGQYDITKNTTCDGKPVLEVNIEEKVVSESYQTILLRLAENVEYSNSVKPICLPFSEFQRIEPTQEIYASGWGLFNDTNHANVKIMKEVKTTVTKNEECSKTQSENLNDGLLLCIKQGDTEKLCSGDEGGPLMQTNNGQWVLEGILHMLYDSSHKPCKRSEPISSFRITNEVLEWIVNNIRE